MTQSNKAATRRRIRARLATPNRSAATIEDVAQRAGVSIKTVSRVINSEPAVRESTRQRVREVVRELDYRPNFSARNLAGARAYLIALLYDNPNEHYVIAVQEGALPACQDAGFGVLLQPVKYDSAQLLASVAALIDDRRPSGLVLTPPLGDQAPLLELLEANHVDYVCLSPADETRPQRCVCADDRDASRRLTEHLLAMGHRRIAFIAGHPAHGAAAHRRLGFEDALRAAHLPEDPALIAPGLFTFDSGAAAAQRLLSMAQPPTAIVASNDEMAAGVLHVAHQRGVQVPRQLSVVGFDNVPLSRYVFPSLTTASQPIRAMADVAIRMLVAGLRRRPDGEAGATSQRFKCELIVRDSTAPVQAPQSPR